MSITRPQSATRSTAIRIAGRVLHASERLLTGIVAAAGLGALIAGIPWGLWHYIGWPLPDHVPTWDEIQSTLLSPMSPRLLLDVLACAIWPLWAKFTLDVALAIPDAISRIPGISRPSGPMRTLAGVLVGTIVVALLGNRGVPVHMGPSAVAVAHLIPSPATAVDLAEQPPGQTSSPGTAIVRSPENGVYDSLWRIAERELGDGNRWPTIWQLNRGKTQVDGRVFSNPNLIRPGWILTLPEAPSPPAPPSPGEHEQDGDSPPPLPTEPTSPPSTTKPSPTSDSPPTTTVTSNPAPQAGTGITTHTGAFVGFGLAALITAALITVRLWRRRTYRPGSGDREGLDIAPVVRALRIAHDEATLSHDEHHQLIHPDTPCGGEASQDVAVRGRALVSAASVLPGDNRTTVVGLRDSQAVALDLARTRGLGLVGPGAIAAARALLVNLLAEGQRSRTGHTAIVVPAADISLLLDGTSLPHVPSRLHVAEDLDEALGVIEAELLSRTRQRLESEDQRPDALVLVATPAPHADRRLQAVLDNGSTLGIASILIGQWLPGGTMRVRADGTISASSPDVGELLVGTRLFTLPSGDTGDLIDLLGAAEEVTTDQADVPLAHGVPSVDRSILPTRAEDDTNEHGERTTISNPRPDGEQQPAEPALLELKVLGRMHLYHGDGGHRSDLIDVVAPKQREILAYLALHPDGVRRDVLTATIWPEAPASRPANSFHATLSQLRKAIRQATQGAVADLAINRDGHCRLDSSVVDVDLWRLRRTLEAFRRDPRDGRQQQAALHALSLYTSDLADGLTADWLDDPRELLRRDVLDAISALVNEIGEDEPHRQLELLERARELDPYNEATYCAIARAQVLLGQHDSVPRTLALLTSALSGIDQRPSPETIALFRSLQRPRALASE